MSMKNTARNYGLVAKVLHWGTAFLFVGAFASVYYRHWFTEAKTPENMTALHLHLSFGISIGVIVLLRIIWRYMNVNPDNEPGTPLEHRAAKVGHIALYAMMIIMPLTGYLGTGIATDFFFLFEITKFADTSMFALFVQDGLGLSFDAFEAPIDFIHKQVFGEWLVWILIVGHICAALYHHFVKKDRTLRKMTVDKG